jgi:hypothetical protein
LLKYSSFMTGGNSIPNRVPNSVSFTATFLNYLASAKSPLPLKPKPEATAGGQDFQWLAGKLGCQGVL